MLRAQPGASRCVDAMYHVGVVPDRRRAGASGLVLPLCGGLPV